MNLYGFMVVILKVILNDELGNTRKELSLNYTRRDLKCIWRHWIKDTMNVDETNRKIRNTKQKLNWTLNFMTRVLNV